MRILVVSTHYPPDFVSGGTLVPQRIARELLGRHHDVRVYAGSLDPTRAPLSSWDDVDEVGLRVRWVANRDFIDWRSRQNYDNPGVTGDFAAYVREFRPDVVHLHSLQALGAPLVGAAKAAGARVVVTMHDFWWVCARQFLATRAARPCSLVVDAGGCPCELDHRWLVRRNAAVQAQLAAADLLLAPSESAAAVLRANGLTSVQVDENGLPPWQPAPRVPRPPGIVRLLFTGGDDPVKGWPVLAAALTGLPPTGWNLTAFGIRPQPDWTLDPTRSARVRLRPPYPPAELPRVLAEHDILVVPSVMRESQSIVTREALQAGLSVVTTDCLGPEEVVTEGSNGRVVKTAEPADLARVLADVVVDPDSVRPDPAAITLRTVADQVAGLEVRYTSLLAGTAAATTWTPRRVLFVVGLDGAPTRYRAHLPAEALRQRGVRAEVRHYRDPRVRSLARRADAVVLYRVPATCQLLALLTELRARPTPPLLLGDVDDLIFDPTLRGTLVNLDGLDTASEQLWWQGVRRYRTTLELLDAFVTTTPALAERGRTLLRMPAFVVPNGVGLELAREADAALCRPRQPGPLRVGYFSGTDTHDHDWRGVEQAVVDVLTERPEVELWLGGHLRTGRALAQLGGRVRRLPFLPWRELAGVLRDLDVNLAPLQLGGVFNESKSAIKWLEAALVETPTVASPTEPFRMVVDDGRNGHLAADPEQWRVAVASLLDDPVTRDRLGARARRDALLTFAPALQAERYLEMLRATRERVSREGRRTPSPDWVPEMLDEPWAAPRLEPYETLPDPVDDARAAVVRTSRLAGAAVRRGSPYLMAARRAAGRSARAVGLR